MVSRGVVAAAAGAGLLAARRYYRNWGTTKEECDSALPGDDLVGEPAVQSTEGIWIDAPAAAVWPWLVQLGQDRAYEPAALAILSFALTWVLMALMQATAQRKPGRGLRPRRAGKEATRP